MRDQPQWPHTPRHVLVITGSHRIARVGPLATAVRDDLGQLPYVPEATVTGAQAGADVVALDALLGLHPHATHHVWVPARPYDNAAVAEITAAHRSAVHEAGGAIRVHECLPGTTYPYRNLCMLQTAWSLRQQGYMAQVRAYPLHPETDGRSRYSGTWKCVRQASQAGLPVYLVPFYAAPT